MAILKFSKKSTKEPKGHDFNRQHHWNFISDKEGTSGLQCRWTDKSLSAFDVLPTTKNVRLAFERLGVTVRYNDFTRSIEISGNIKPETEGELNDARLAVTLSNLQDIFGMKITSGDLNTKLNVISRQNRYDPLKNYHLSLKWDGTERAEAIWIDYANAEDTPLNRAYGRLFTTSMVARCFYPGIKVDEVITLIGEQGGGKSSLAKDLTPIGPSAFSDQVVIGADGKQIIEQTRGKALLEHSEDWRGRYSEPQRKACLSTTADRARGAYQRHVDEVPRRFMFIATTNNEFPIMDPTGARREWLVQTKGQFKHLKPGIRDQIYAEVTSKYILPVLQSGMPEDAQRREVREFLVLPKELWADQAKIAESYRHPPDLITEVKFTLKMLQWPVEVSMIELLDAMFFKNGVASAPKSANQKVGEAMKWLGYRGKRKNVKGGAKVMCYCWDKQVSPEEYHDSVKLDSTFG